MTATSPLRKPIDNLFRRILRRLRPPRRLRTTREGKYFILLTLGVGFAAINTGNNLLYLLLGMLLALIIVSGVMSESSLKKLRVRRRLPKRAQVGRTHLVEIEVFNEKSKIPSYAIEVEDLREGQPPDKRCFFLKISPQGGQVAAYRIKPKKRGRSKHTGFRIATRFPFGLFEKSLIYPSHGSLIVYPEVHPVQPNLPRKQSRSGLQPTNGHGLGDSISSVRPMQYDDDAREIYWKKSTTPGQMVIKQRSRETKPIAVVRLNDVMPPNAGNEWKNKFEKDVSQAASETVYFAKHGWLVRLQTQSGKTVEAIGGNLDPILSTLALIKPSKKSGSPRDSRNALTLPPAKGTADRDSSQGVDS